MTALASARDREAAATWHAEQREAPMHAMRFILFSFLVTFYWNRVNHTRVSSSLCVASFVVVVWGSTWRSHLLVGP